MITIGLRPYLSLNLGRIVLATTTPMNIREPMNPICSFDAHSKEYYEIQLCRLASELGSNMWDMTVFWDKIEFLFVQKSIFVH
jgi:hypothetical protein